MNERIRELAEQAEFRFYEGDKVGTPLFGDWIKDGALEKFAELIVQECIGNLEFHGHDEAVDQLEWFRRKHFGVE